MSTGQDKSMKEGESLAMVETGIEIETETGTDAVLVHGDGVCEQGRLFVTITDHDTHVHGRNPT